MKMEKEEAFKRLKASTVRRQCDGMDTCGLQQHCVTTVYG